jgi:hypothetical protein
MTSVKTKLYVGCSLTHAPEEFKGSVERLKDKLLAEGYEVFDFIGLVDGTPRDVYEQDVHACVGGADGLIAICDYPSIGLGWEMCEAVRLGKRVLAVAHKDTRVTRLVQGAAEVEPNCTFERYDNLVDDVAEKVKQLLPPHQDV